jgi:hypothetical protein
MSASPANADGSYVRSSLNHPSHIASSGRRDFVWLCILFSAKLQRPNRLKIGCDLSTGRSEIRTLPNDQDMLGLDAKSRLICVSR